MGITVTHSGQHAHTLIAHITVGSVLPLHDATSVSQRPAALESNCNLYISRGAVRLEMEEQALVYGQTRVETFSSPAQGGHPVPRLQTQADVLVGTRQV